MSYPERHQQLIDVIKEYLITNNYASTVSALTVQFIQTEHQQAKNTPYSAVVLSIEKGDLQQFIQVWNQIPQKERNSQNGKRLEFLCRVFIAVFPVHQACIGSRAPSETDMFCFKTSLQHFKVYLESSRDSLSDSQDVLVFYALSYIHNPLNHQAFRGLYSIKWLQKLKQELQKFLGGIVVSEKQTMLIQMYEVYLAQPKQTIQQPKIKELQSQNRNLRIQFQERELRWETYTENLQAAAREIHRLFQVQRQGKLIDQAIIRNAFQKFGIFDQSQPEPPVVQTYQEKKEGLVKGHSDYQNINYASVIRDLQYLQDDWQICALLQALRWRLTRSTSQARREILEFYIRFNILCTSKPHDILLDHLLTSTRRVKQYTVRLLNVMASERGSRNYLLLKQNIVQLLISVLISQKNDTILRQNALGVLQKLSLRRSAQTIMIQLDMLDWLIKVLKHQTDTIGDYTLQYASALLMNLSLRTSGKLKLEKHPHQILNLLNKFLTHQNTQVRTYINGTLYSILTRKVFKDAAHKFGLDRRVKYLKSHADQSIKRQLGFILEQLRSEEEHQYASDETDQEAEDSDLQSDTDDLIAEDQDMDDLINLPNVLTGEQLLVEKYMHQDFFQEEIEEEIPVEGSYSKRVFSKPALQIRDQPKRKEIPPVKRSHWEHKEEDRQVNRYEYAFQPKNAIPRTPL